MEVDLDFAEEPTGIPPWDFWVRLNGRRYAFSRPSMHQLALLAEINKLPDEQKCKPLIQLLGQMSSIDPAGLDSLTIDQVNAIISAMCELIDRRALYRASIAPSHRPGLFDQGALN